jgi:hypothetical protein
MRHDIVVKVEITHSIPFPFIALMIYLSEFSLVFYMKREVVGNLAQLKPMPLFFKVHCISSYWGDTRDNFF